MKILVLMPLDEQHVPAATALYQALPKEIKEITFALPMYMEYLVKTKIEPSWEEAVVRSLFDSKKLLEVLDEKDNYILIGNTTKDFKFNEIYNFQDIDRSAPYEDKFLEKVKQIFSDIEEPILQKLLNETYSNSDSKLALHNCIASADFLSKIVNTMDTKDHYDKVIQKYKIIIGE